MSSLASSNGGGTQTANTSAGFNNQNLAGRCHEAAAERPRSRRILGGSNQCNVPAPAFGNPENPTPQAAAFFISIDAAVFPEIMTDRAVLRCRSCPTQRTTEWAGSLARAPR